MIDLCIPFMLLYIVVIQCIYESYNHIFEIKILKVFWTPTILVKNTIIKNSCYKYENTDIRPITYVCLKSLAENIYQQMCLRIVHILANNHQWHVHIQMHIDLFHLSIVLKLEVFVFLMQEIKRMLLKFTSSKFSQWETTAWQPSFNDMVCYM